MSIEILRAFMGWCAAINIALLLWWFFWILFAHDFVFRVHNRLFRISAENFDVIHYAGMVFYKIAIIVFIIIPYLALLIVM